MRIYALLLMLWVAGLTACGDSSSDTTTTHRPAPAASYYSVESPRTGKVLVYGDSVELVLGTKANAPALDSVEIYVGPDKVATTTTNRYMLTTGGGYVGRQQVRMVVFAGEHKETKRVSITVNSDVVPEAWSYRIAKVYPHDPAAFTQGLEWYNGALYEGTGMHGTSSIRKVDLGSGAVQQKTELEESLFGEGITRVGEEWVQLTWRARTGIVYDAETLAEKRRFSYPTEGWGIAYTGSELIMSDGSQKLYVLQPDSYASLRSFSVFDDKGAVPNLNELEYIDGYLYANIWMTDKIAKIDPATGRVLAYIDLTGLLPENQRSGNEDVLNGIAHDPATGRIFLTGKNWPSLFEVQWYKRG